MSATNTQAELDEVFLYSYREGGLRAALDAHARAAVIYAAGNVGRRRKPPSRLTLEPIRIVCELYGLRPAQLLERSKRSPLPDARAVAAKVLREHGNGYSLHVIGDLLAIDHSSVVSAIRRCDQSTALTEKALWVLARMDAKEEKAA